MRVGPSKHFDQVMVILLDENESEYERKFRLLSRYCYTLAHEPYYMENGDVGEYDILYFDVNGWAKLMKKKYMIGWLLEADSL